MIVTFHNGWFEIELCNGNCFRALFPFALFLLDVLSRLLSFLYILDVEPELPISFQNSF